MGPPKLVIFGGNGFVGSRVCEEALKTGLSVVSVNRSGPPKQSADWVKGVEWVQVSLPLPCQNGTVSTYCILTDMPPSSRAGGHFRCQLVAGSTEGRRWGHQLLGRFWVKRFHAEGV